MFKKKKVFIILAAIFGGFVLLILGGSYFIGTQIVASSTELATNEKTKNVHNLVWPDYNFDLAQYQSKYQIEKLEIKSSFDEHILPFHLIYNENTTKGLVVMAHGLGGNKETNYPVSQMFLENGYKVITYDQRCSGENYAPKTTFGYWEKYDIIDCVNYAKNKLNIKKIIVWGESFGGATAVQAVAFEEMQKTVDYLILDCPVSSMSFMLYEEMKEMDMGIPVDYLMWWGNLANKIQLGFSYDDADSAQVAKKITIPSLVINSEVDTVTPYFMGKDIFDNLSSSKKDIWTVKDSKHIGMWLDYNQEYREKVINFIEN